MTPSWATKYPDLEVGSTTIANFTKPLTLKLFGCLQYTRYSNFSSPIFATTGLLGRKKVDCLPAPGAQSLQRVREHTTLNCPKPLKSCLKITFRWPFVQKGCSSPEIFDITLIFVIVCFAKKAGNLKRDSNIQLLLVKPRKFCWHCKEIFWAETLQISKLLVTVDNTNKWCDQHCFF